MSESPADTLTRAADALESAARHATRTCPAWVYRAVRHINRNCDILCPDDHPEGVDDNGVDHIGWDRYEDHKWISMMSPTVAAPLAAWLRSASRHGSELESRLAPEATQWHRDHAYDHNALEFARSILVGGRR